MQHLPRLIRHLAIAAGTALALAACGGGGGGGGSSNPPPAPPPPSTSNVVALHVSGGPTNNVNLPLVSVRICETVNNPACITVDNIAVDTGSTGLRVLRSALGALSLQNSVAGNPLFECTKFADTSHVWGETKVADVQIGDKTTSSLRIEAIGSAPGVTEPAACGTAADNMDTVAKLGTNGILGLGYFAEDCGPACVSLTSPGIYYTCPASGCVASTAALADQVANPVMRFASDNNGVIIQLPAVPAAGAASVDGSLIFGIGTQSNNALGSAKVLAVDPSTGNIGTSYKGTTYPHSFVDSGSNGLYFPDPSIPTCASNAQFYCPATTLSLSATLLGSNGASASTTFGIANAESFGASIFVIGNFGGVYAAGFDWGLPFFFGHSVYTAFENNSGGPYIAF